MSSEEEKPKIISDEDWKVEAQKEKEKLSDEPVQSAGPSDAAGDVAGEAVAGAGAGRPLPEANFSTLLNTLALQALLYMGRLSDPNNPEVGQMVNLDLAKHNIDLLQVLEDKTKGNLTEDESKALSMAIHELRMQFVQMAS